MGWLALGCGLACFSQTDDRRFKLFMAGECAAYIVHFALLGQATAVASTTVSLLRSLAALRTRSRRVGLFFIALSAGLGLALATGWSSLLPIAASCIGSVALFFLQGLHMRLLMLAGTLLWLVNNLLVGSVGGSLLEALLALANLRTCWQLWRQPREGHAQSSAR